MRAEIISKITVAKKLKLPLFQTKVSAGFPSPADDFIEKQIDLNEHLIENPASTYLVKATGESMKNAGIFPEDILVVDRSKRPKNNDIVVAAIDGEILVKGLNIQGDKVTLVAENPDYPPIEIESENELVIWGVVTHVIHKPSCSR